jgi:hypothetical protein
METTNTRTFIGELLFVKQSQRLGIYPGANVIGYARA